MSLAGELERCWPWLAAAAARGRERGLAKAGLLDLLLTGQAMLWPGEEGALVTQCLVTPEGRFVHCWLGGGALRTLLALRPGVEAWGRAAGCDQASINGRKGWDRVFQPFGYRRIGSEIRKSLMSSSKTTTQNSTTTNTPTNPQWVTDSSQAMTGKLMDLLNQSPNSFFAGPGPLQANQFDLAQKLGQQGADWTAQAGTMAATPGGANTAQYGGYNPAMMQAAQLGPAAQAQAQTAYGGIGNYMNPFQTQVANTTLQQLNQANQMALNDVGSGAILAGQYGGSRQGVAQALTNSQFQQNAAGALANLNLQGFNTALGAANNDADRAQQTSLANAQAANQFATTQAQMDQQAAVSNQSANNNAWQYNAGVYNAGNQFDASAADAAANRQLQGAQILGGLGSTGLNYLSSSGAAQQAINQAQASSPLTVLQQLAGSYGSLPLTLFHGGTTVSDGTTKETDSLGGLDSLVGAASKLGFSPLSNIKFPN